MAYWNCKQCVHTVRGRKCQYIKINGPNCMLSWEYFWPEDGSDLCSAEQESILLPCYLCQHKCAAHLTSVHREQARVQGQLDPWGSCLITTWGKGKLHLWGASPPKPGLLQKLHVESQAPMTAQSWKEGGESKETWLRSILNKSHHCRWAEFTPQKFLFSLHFSVGRVRLSICIGFLPWLCEFSGVGKMLVS